MSPHAEHRDSIQSKLAQDLSESSRGGETLDPVVTEAAVDQNQKITRKPDDSVAQSKTAKQFSQLLPTHDVPAASGTIEQPSGRLVSNAIATLVNAMPEEMKTLIVEYAKQILRESSDDQT
jgi:hypothetical protein